MAIYFDNASTTPVHPEVLEAMLPFFKDHFGNPSSTHSQGRKSRAPIELGRKKLAEILNVSPLELCFNSGGTEGNNNALTVAARDLEVTRFISSPIEHKCVLKTCKNIAEDFGIELEYVPLRENAMIDLDALDEMLAKSDKKTLVTIMHANNEIGNMTSIEKMSAICLKHGALLHTDIVQSFGHYKFDFAAHPVDFFSLSGHKFHGPKGVGVMYVNKKHPIRAFINGGGQERDIRSGTLNAPGIVGLCKAAEVAYRDFEETEPHITKIKMRLWQGLKEMGVVSNGDAPENTLNKVLNVGFPPSKYAEIFLLKLDIEGFCVSAGSACSSGASAGSHVLQALGIDPSWPCIRFSFSRYNTEAEVDQLLATLKTLVKTESPSSIEL